MSDTFKNFYNSTNTSGDYLIIPVSDGTNRDLASLLEIHDLNITASKNGSSLDENWQAIIDIYIKDNGNNYFLYNYIILKDGESWHNEKSFSLMYNQSLYFKVRNNISNGKVTVSSSCFQREDLNAEYYTLTLNTNPTNANAILTCGSLISTNKKIKVPSGSNVSYTVSASTYATTTGNSIVNSDETLNINLIKLYYVKVTTNVENPTITLTAPGYSQSGDLIYVKKGTTVSYTVSAPNYVTKTGTIEVSNSNPQNITRQITLDYVKFTFTINPTPNDATVSLSGTGGIQTGNSILVPYNTTVSYTVSKSGYISQSGTYKVVSNSSKNISLQLSPNTVIFESSVAGTYNVNLPYNGKYQLIMVGGGGGGLIYKNRVGRHGIYYISAGGSGGYVTGTIQVSRGTYSIIVGAGGSSASATIDTSIHASAGGSSSAFNQTAEGGGGGYYRSSGSGGSYTISGGELTGTNGNSGGYRRSDDTGVFAYGGASVYGGYGKGGNANSPSTSHSGVAGYVKITYVSQS